MARKPMVTRTITSTKATVMAVDLEHNAEVVNKTFVMPRTYNDNETLLKAIKKQYETPELPIIKVVDVEKQEALYGMEETDFIAHAKPLDPETRKVLEAENEAE